MIPPDRERPDRLEIDPLETDPLETDPAEPDLLGEPQEERPVIRARSRVREEPSIAVAPAAGRPVARPRTEAAGEPAAAVSGRWRRRPPRWVKAALIALWFPLVFGAAVLETERQGSRPNLDEAWKIGFAQRWAQGELAGRDFSFTHGPASQAIAALGAAWHQGRSLIAARPLVDLVFVALNLLLLAGILLAIPEVDGWWIVPVLGAIEVARIAEHYASVRVLVVVAVALALAAAASARTPVRRSLLAALAGLLVLGSQLLSADNLVYACSTVAAGGASIALHRARGSRGDLLPAPGSARAALEATGVTLATAALGNLVLALLFATPRRPFGSYHRDLIEISEGYALTMGLPWSLPAASTAGLLLAGTLVAGWLIIRAPAMSMPARTRALALVVAAALTVRGALTRSDPGHLHLALTAATLLVVLAGALGAGGSGRRPHARGWLVLAVAACGWLVSLPLDDWTAPARVASVVARTADVRHHLTRLRHSTLGRRTVLPGGLRRLSARAWQLDRMPERLAVIPYQNELALAIGSELTGELLQAYSAHQPATQQRYLEALWRERGAGVLLVLESARHPPLDRVTTPIRLPVIVRGLLERYRPVAPQAAPGYLLLERRAAVEPLRAEPIPLGGRVRGRGSIEALLDSPRGCRLLELRLAIAYGPRLLLGRAAPMELSAHLGDGRTVASRLLTLDRRRPFAVLLPLIPQARFAELWSPGAEEGPRARTVRIRVLADAGLDVAPGRLEIESVTCLVR